MKLNWVGHACFWIEHPVSIVMDAFDEGVSKNFPAINAEIVTESHAHFDHAAHERVKGPFVLIKETGTKMYPKVKVEGFSSFHDTVQGTKRGKNTLFKFTFDDGLTVLHLGDLGHELDESTIAAIATVDVLLIPVGGIYTIDATVAKKIIQRLAPRVFIPMHYQSPLLKELNSLESFTKGLATEVVRQDHLILTKETTSHMKGICVILSPIVKTK